MGFNVNKNDLVNKIASATGLTKTQANHAIDAFWDAVTDALAKHERVVFVGHGTFSTAKRKATEGRNPRTGAVIKIPASNRVKFKVGKGLQDAVNGRAPKKKAAAKKKTATKGTMRRSA